MLCLILLYVEQDSTEQRKSVAVARTASRDAINDGKRIPIRRIEDGGSVKVDESVSACISVCVGEYT